MQNEAGPEPNIESEGIKSEFDAVQGALQELRAEVKELRNYASDLLSALSSEARILRDAVNRIDPKAIRSTESIREWDNASQGRYEAHAKGQRHPTDYEPSLIRLEEEVLKIGQELQSLKKDRGRQV